MPVSWVYAWSTKPAVLLTLATTSALAPKPQSSNLPPDVGTRVRLSIATSSASATRSVGLRPLGNNDEPPFWKPRWNQAGVTPAQVVRPVSGIVATRYPE